MRNAEFPARSAMPNSTHVALRVADAEAAAVEQEAMARA